MTFKVADLLRNASESKHSRLKTKEAVYLELWEALMRWLRSQMEKKQSVKIPSFGTWRWIAAEGATTGAAAQKASSLRPTFQLSDSFCKKYCVVNKGCDTSRRPGTKVKEINVYEVAIRFSNALQKDTVFTGLKDVIEAIGEACHSRTTVKLECGEAGTLVVKDSKAIFMFEAEWEPHLAAAGSSTANPAWEEMIELEPGAEEAAGYGCAGMDLPSALRGGPGSTGGELLEITGGGGGGSRPTSVPQLALGEIPANRVSKKAKSRPKTGLRSKKSGAFGHLAVKKENIFHPSQELPQRGGQALMQGGAWQPPGMHPPVVSADDYALGEDYIRQLYEEFKEQGGVFEDELGQGQGQNPTGYLEERALRAYDQTAGARPTTASTTVSYLDRDELLTPGGKARMKRWVRHEGLAERNRWKKEPIERQLEPIPTPAPQRQSKKIRSTKRGKPKPQGAVNSAGRLFLDDTPAARPRTAMSLGRSQFL